MNIENVKKVAVIGAGNMGHQVGTLCAMHGYDTYITDTNPEQLKKAHSFVEEYLPGRVTKGRITQEACDQAFANIHFTDKFEAAVGDADIVIEAVFEQIDLKKSIFKRLDECCKPEALLVTNASAIPSSTFKDCVKNPGRICNMHFFNPALVMKCVEVMRGEHTAQETFDTVVEFAKRLDKVPAKIERELHGMIGSRFSSLLLEEACAILEGGYATAEDIDAVAKNALGHPMGPFELVDLTGIDMCYIIPMDRFRHSGDRKDLPWPIMVKKYFDHEWGRKTGKGFYDYTGKDDKAGK